jgi:hypothetical protein
MSLTAKETRLQRAILVLTRYARHAANCRHGAPNHCNCGLSAALAEFAEANREARAESLARPKRRPS